jgi:hypothetical protein
MSFFSSKSTIKHRLKWLINDFENSKFIKFISNYCTCFHNVLKTLSSKHIKEMCNTNIIFDKKHEKQNTGYNSYDSYICEYTLYG